MEYPGAAAVSRFVYGVPARGAAPLGLTSPCPWRCYAGLAAGAPPSRLPEVLKLRCWKCGGWQGRFRYVQRQDQLRRAPGAPVVQ